MNRLILSFSIISHSVAFGSCPPLPVTCWHGLHIMGKDKWCRFLLYCKVAFVRKESLRSDEWSLLNLDSLNFYLLQWKGKIYSSGNFRQNLIPDHWFRATGCFKWAIYDSPNQLIWWSLRNTAGKFLPVRSGHNRSKGPMYTKNPLYPLHEIEYPTRCFLTLLLKNLSDVLMRHVKHEGKYFPHGCASPYVG